MSADRYDDCPKCKAVEIMREDFEVGFLNGVFFVDYKGVCGSCGFSFEYNIEKHNIIKDEVGDDHE